MREVSRAKRVFGSLRAHSDKSLTHRALIFSALAREPSEIVRPLTSQDTLSTAKCLSQMGVKFQMQPGSRLEINPPGQLESPIATLNCANSGTTARLLAGILSTRRLKATLDGDDSLRSRPMDRVVLPLAEMGAKFNQIQLPLTVSGTDKGCSINYSSKVSSGQVKSAVLLAAMNVTGTTTYTEPHRSRDHTERMLGHLGAPIAVNGNTVRLTGPFSPNGFQFAIPGDPSSCAFLATVAACVPDSFIIFNDVLLNPLRLGYFRLLQKIGVALSFAPKEERFGETVGDLWVGSATNLQPFQVSAQESPTLVDEAPLACLVATQCSGTSEFTGLAELKVKESDRLKETAEILNQFGAKVELTEDGWIVEGPTSLKAANIVGQHDHRMVMLAACAALMADGTSTVQNPEVVSVSYPGFWEDLEKHVEV